MKDPIAYMNEQVEVLPAPLPALCRGVINAPEFQAGWGSEDKHHAYRGALAWHTAEVLEIALAQAQASSIDVNLTVLIPAVIFHDCMKIRDYDENGKGTDYKDKIYHVAGSYGVWYSETVGVLPDDYVDAVGHCILAHHGRREWKSCNEPKTIEALILHQSDMLSARYGKSMNKPEEAINETK